MLDKFDWKVSLTNEENGEEILVIFPNDFNQKKINETVKFDANWQLGEMHCEINYLFSSQIRKYKLKLVIKSFWEIYFCKIETIIDFLSCFQLSLKYFFDFLEFNL